MKDSHRGRALLLARRVVVGGSISGGLLGAVLLEMASRDETPGRPLLAGVFGALFGLVLGATLGTLSTLPAAAALMVLRMRTTLTHRCSAALAGLVGGVVVLGCTTAAAGVGSASLAALLVLVVTVVSVLAPADGGEPGAEAVRSSS